MKLQLYFFILLFIQIALTNCKQSNNKGEIRKVDFFDPLALGAIDKTSKLSFETRFSECGEWSGHLEKVIIFADTSMSIHARYQVFPYNCDSLDYYYGNDNLNPKVDTILSMGEKEKQSIVNYIQLLTQAKISEKVIPSNTGNVFSIVNSDSTFFIQVFDNNESVMKGYKMLIDELIK